MYAVKRQFRIWGHEIREVWGAIPFLGRVFLGAAVSLSLALFGVKSVIKRSTRRSPSCARDWKFPKISIRKRTRKSSCTATARPI